MSLPDPLVNQIRNFNEFADGVPATDEVIVAFLKHIRKEYVDDGNTMLRIHDRVILNLKIWSDEDEDDDMSLEIEGKKLVSHFMYLEEGWTNLTDSHKMKYVDPVFEFPATIQGFLELRAEVKLLAPDFVSRGPCPATHEPTMRMRMKGARFCADCSLKATFSVA